MTIDLFSNLQISNRLSQGSCVLFCMSITNHNNSKYIGIELQIQSGNENAYKMNTVSARSSKLAEKWYNYG